MYHYTRGLGLFASQTRVRSAGRFCRGFITSRPRCGGPLGGVLRAGQWLLVLLIVNLRLLFSLTVAHLWVFMCLSTVTWAQPDE